MSLLCLNRHLPPYAYVFRLRAKMLPFASRKNKTEGRGGREGVRGETRMSRLLSFVKGEKKKKRPQGGPCVPFSVTFRITIFSMGAHLGTRKSAATWFFFLLLFFFYPSFLPSFLWSHSSFLTLNTIGKDRFLAASKQFQGFIQLLQRNVFGLERRFFFFLVRGRRSFQIVFKTRLRDVICVT